MASSLGTRGDTTVAFLPHRLNRQPVIVRGLTADELWVTVSLSAAGGLALGIAFATLTQRIAMVPTVIVVSVAVGVFAGGTVLRSQKRGRPETWLYRQMQWWVARRLPVLAGYLGARDLITRSGPWTTHREKRR
jgi:conjugative transfer region protein (TIGR03750 family)